jgi:hypothetical protein
MHPKLETLPSAELLGKLSTANRLWLPVASEIERLNAQLTAAKQLEDQYFQEQQAVRQALILRLSHALAESDWDEIMAHLAWNFANMGNSSNLLVQNIAHVFAAVATNPMAAGALMRGMIRRIKFLEVDPGRVVRNPPSRVNLTHPDGSRVSLILTMEQRHYVLYRSPTDAAAIQSLYPARTRFSVPDTGVLALSIDADAPDPDFVPLELCRSASEPAGDYYIDVYSYELAHPEVLERLVQKIIGMLKTADIMIDDQIVIKR